MIHFVLKVQQHNTDVMLQQLFLHNSLFKFSLLKENESYDPLP